ncbi:hypothetical protein A3H10_02655 [Candidatus Uhrbacteria bacterium RIFCSPLOWO2_12_FULL_46_10]|uniref:Sortilin N-terminal domain-containing protein n=1 Tax=Candidatus Uhrbacteria bacterium RIFCSPLOWO2_01_FULL_47_25 TaxID=1802402 RepID=A0A1F7UV43_9BACT|nr:MAG: hypothetical protein A2752_02415 [Candidatus Uhrbacteria bacterium RIFCSPHIGHO2_01_FULL_46_23]OGL68713.1 MAG: hypothetical protein A3D60_02020 [Candidatus Uhrbacteria bacterium RIFCSPHIGHO2_02_FULL_47_29]OGL74739.1 MAG: hypothetical protein A3E96_03305 [Candidatus Uhrbacteria bacterium RIFCSPHIGHO2_12_FULL_46_13]OGL82150.1 MAG: hypothetical protein A2936_01135 [Candidatus Uhrbacteria bacterium RIFCSPLOWO2_01_FULL_47_25]OGL85659.1 MAG: hypothetical protein A3I37_04260 [Candidatus Uhrbact
MITKTTIHRGLIFAALPLTLFLSGCSITDFIGFGGQKQGPPPPPVGIYKSIDRGDNWVTRNSILSANPAARPTLDNINVQTLILDPTDSRTLYLGSQGQGLYYSYDGGDSWWPSGPIRQGDINAIAVSSAPSMRCTIYIATANRILRTTDCGRFWDQLYYDTRLQEKVLTLAINQENPAMIYAGLTTGEVLKSSDAGKSWETIARLQGRINRIVKHALKASTIYLIIEGRGFWRSEDSGATWQDMSEDLKKFPGALSINDLVVDPMRPDTVITASKYGLVRTTDGGSTWSALPLLTPPSSVDIFAVALNPNNSTELYYTTDRTLYRSQDAGKTWETKTLPVPGAHTILLVDPKVPTTQYLGVARTGKK